MGERKKTKKLLDYVNIYGFDNGLGVPVTAGQYKEELLQMEVSEARCSHVHITLYRSYDFLMVSDWSHKKIEYRTYHCDDCNSDVRIVKEEMGEESHTLAYKDQGHTYGAGAHSYLVGCSQCSYSQGTSVPCPDNSSTHNTPW